MVKIFRNFLLVLLAILLLLVIATYWVLATPAGTRWSLRQLEKHSDQRLQLEGIDGTLLGDLRLTGVSFVQQGQRLSLARLQLNWHIANLVGPHLAIDQLILEQVEFELAAAKENTEAANPPRLVLPQVPAIVQQLRIDLQQLELKQVVLRPATGAPLTLERLTTGLQWRNGRLQFDELDLLMPDLQAQGQLALQLDSPLLTIDGRLTAIQESPWREIEMQAELAAPALGKPLQGPVKIQLIDSEERSAQLRSVITINEQNVKFEQLDLKSSAFSGSVAGHGQVDLRSPEPELQAELELSKLDLQALSGQPLRLSGKVDLSATAAAFAGSFALRNAGAKINTIDLSGDFQGSPEEVEFNDLQADWLNGTVTGEGRFALLEQGWQASARLTAKQLNPQPLRQQLAGRLNLRLDAQVQQQGQQPLSGRIQLQLDDSILQGQPLVGDLKARFHDRKLLLDNLHLQGEGIVIDARGDLRQRLDFAWEIDSLAQILSDLRGRSAGQGWLTFRDQTLAGEIDGSGAELAYRNWRLERIDLTGSTAAALQGNWQLQAEMDGLQGPQPALQLDHARLDAEGSPTQHQVQIAFAQGTRRLRAGLTGGWRSDRWQGELTTLELLAGNWGQWHLQQSAALELGPELVQSKLLTLRSTEKAEIELAGDYRPQTGQAAGQLAWQEFDLALLQPWLVNYPPSGRSAGRVTFAYGPRTAFSGEIHATGQVQGTPLPQEPLQADGEFSWDAAGLNARLGLKAEAGPQLSAVLKSPLAATLNLPQRGELTVSVQAFPLAWSRPWLPPGLATGGRVNAQGAASWSPKSPPKLQGTISTNNVFLQWKEGETPVRVAVEQGLLEWRWAEQLEGQLSLDLGDYGALSATFLLPLQADLPMDLSATTPLQAKLAAELVEPGLLATLFPERIEDSRGRLQLDLSAAGSWAKPALNGTFQFYEGRAYLPQLGIQLEKLSLTGKLSEAGIRLTSLSLDSGGGSLRGQGEVVLDNWRPEQFQLQLTGERVQVLDLPELQVLASPDLRLQGKGRSINVRGSVVLPEVWVQGKRRSNLARNSSDLVVVDRQEQRRQPSSWRRDIDLDIVLGEQVVVDTAGLNARLQGKLQLRSQGQQELAAYGKIQVAKGQYSSYGVKLDITRGALYFSGSALARPTLDILATRSIGEVSAGVKVAGTPDKPEVALYSDPIMPDSDILSYIVLGRPVGGQGGDNDLLMTAAGALLSQGESVALQEKLKARLGLDVIEVDSGSGEVEEASITTGKYLTPDLYISLGYSLFKNTNEVNLRYRLTPKWELESSIGVESGIDLYHLIEIE